MRSVATLVLVALILTGCGYSAADARPVLCAVAGRLTTAQALVEEAVMRASAGDLAGAAQLATRAASTAQDGHDQLQAITATEVRHDDVWQSLLKAYLHLGQAANALLPGYGGGPAMATSELQAGSDALRSARASVPASCFAANAQSSDSGADLVRRDA